MVKCCVEGCRSNSKFSTEDITFHRFPDVRCFPKLFLKWSQKVSGCPEDEAPDVVPQPSDRVCSLHFTEDDFAIRTDRNRTRRALRVDSLPTQRLPPERKPWGPGLSELAIGQVTGNYDGPSDMSSVDANGNTDANGVARLPTPDDGIPRDPSKASHLPPKMARKRIKIEHKEVYRLPIRSSLERDELEALIQAKESEISFPDHPDSSQPQTECDDNGNVEDVSHIPPCFRSKKDLHSLFAYVVVPLEPEEGLDVMMINDNKYVRFGTPDLNENQMWRCILKNCGVRVTTSSVHCSILFGVQGMHYHLPTKDLAVNPAEWVKAVEPDWSAEAEKDPATEEEEEVEVEEVSGGEARMEPAKVPPWVRNSSDWPKFVSVDSRFGVKDILAPSVDKFQNQNVVGFHQPAMTPIENIQAAFASLTKYSGGQLIAAVDPFSALRFPGSGSFSNLAPEPSGVFHRPQSEDSSMGPQSTPPTAHQEEQEYIIQSPASVRSNIIVDEASEGSCPNPEHLGSRLEEPLYERMVDDVDSIMQKDPLALEESNDGDPKSDDQQPTEGPGTGRLPPDFVSFFDSLGPHLELLSPNLRQLFKAKVVLILSELCKKGSAVPET